MIGVEPGGGAHRAGHAPKGRRSRWHRRRRCFASWRSSVTPDARSTRRSASPSLSAVAGDRGGRRRGERGIERHGRELAAVVAIQLQSGGAGVDEVGVAIAVEIGERQAAGICGGGIRGNGAEVDESHVGHGFVDEPGLCARRRDRLGVASLLEVRLRERHRVAALAQLLELVHRRAPLVCGAAAHQRGGEAVGGGGVEGLGLDGRPQQLDRLVETALLHEELSQVDRGADVGRIELTHVRERARPHRPRGRRPARSGRGRNRAAADRAARSSPLRAPCAPPRARRRRTARCRDSAARAPAPDRSRAHGGRRRWRRGSRYCSRRATPMLLAR